MELANKSDEEILAVANPIYGQFVLTWLLLVFSVSAMSEPIKCGSAKSDVEKLVCSTPELRWSDILLGLAYDDALHRVNIEEKNRLVTEQVQWVENKRSSCSDSDCLARSYASRILTITLNKEVEVVRISSAKSSVRLADIKRDIQRMKIPLDIESCDAMTEVWQPVNQQRISSYGAICNLPATRAKVMTCNDYMVGKFQILIGFGVSTLDLAKFIATYCAPGG